MQKNVKGYIGLFTALAAIILIGVAVCWLNNPINGTSLSLHGSINIYMALIGTGLGLIAMIFGILSLKGKDTQKGPRKAGIILGILVIFFGLIISLFLYGSKELVSYANGDPNTILAQADEQQKKEFDDLLQQVRQEYPEK